MSVRVLLYVWCMSALIRPIEARHFDFDLVDFTKDRKTAEDGSASTWHAQFDILDVGGNSDDADYGDYGGYGGTASISASSSASSSSTGTASISASSSLSPSSTVSLSSSASNSLSNSASISLSSSASTTASLSATISVSPTSNFVDIPVDIRILLNNSIDDFGDDFAAQFASDTASALQISVERIPEDRVILTSAADTTVASMQIQNKPEADGFTLFGAGGHEKLKKKVIITQSADSQTFVDFVVLPAEAGSDSSNEVSAEAASAEFVIQYEDPESPLRTTTTLTEFQPNLSFEPESQEVNLCADGIDVPYGDSCPEDDDDDDEILGGLNLAEVIIMFVLIGVVIIVAVVVLKRRSNRRPSSLGSAAIFNGLELADGHNPVVVPEFETEAADDVIYGNNEYDAVAEHNDTADIHEQPIMVI